MKRIGAFLACAASTWPGLVSAVGGLLLTSVGSFIPADRLRPWFLVVGVFCLLLACFRAWLTVERQREELVTRLQPTLQFVHQGGVKPFFEEFSDQAGPRSRYLRIGLKNVGGTDIAQARLVLEACEPNTAEGVLLEHELQPMGKPKGTLTALVPAFGTVVFDVAAEFVGADGRFTDLRVCYAQPIAKTLPPRDQEPYELILRAEGGGPAVRCSARLGAKLTWRLDGVKVQGGTEGPD